MVKGISNIQIGNALRNLGDEDINDKFVGAFLANHMNRFIDYKTMISDKKEKYPFIIANTNSSDKDDPHWWSIMDIEPQNGFFFRFVWR